MSRILFLSQLLPYPLDSGAKVRSYYVIRHLANTHEVTLLAFTRPGDSDEAVLHLRKICKDVHLVTIHRSFAKNLISLVYSILSRESFTIHRDFIPEMARIIDHLLISKQFDYVHSDQLWMAQYALRARKLAQKPRLILDEHNACFQIYQRLAIRERNKIKRILLMHESRMMHEYEAKTCALFDFVVTVTDEDRNALRSILNLRKNQTVQSYSNIPYQNFATIPICVETESIQPIKPNLDLPNVLHLGTMFWLPNIEGVLWFTREVWPKILARVPQATFVIAGKNPPSAINTLSKYQDGRQTIQITGYVADPQPYLEQAGVFIVPLLSGGGMRVKIVDAWRWGLPIVSTSIGAEGIYSKPGENILIADNPEAFAQAVAQVLLDPLLAQRLRINGRQWVEENYNWRKVYNDWDSIYIDQKN